MGHSNEKAPADVAAEAKSLDGGLNKHNNSTAFGGRSKAQSSAEEKGGETFLDAGLQAVRRGWKIFPCNGKKIPLTPHGFKDASADEAQITAWAKSHPGALWGLALPKDTVVIDLDMKYGKNGKIEFERLQGCRPDEFGAPRVITGTGGVHLYTDPNGRDFKNTADIIALGVDTKTDGGYVIIPSGDGFYRWETGVDTPKPPTPQWAEVALRQREESKGNGAGSSGHYEWPSGFGQEKLNYFCKLVREAQEGHWDETACKLFKFGRWAGGGAIDVNVALEALEKAARECKAPPDYPKKVKRIFLNGVKEPEGLPDVGVSLTDFCAYMPQHSYIYIPTREPWPASSVNARIASVPVFDSKGEPLLDKKGEQVKIKANTWLDQNRPIEQMTWVPGEETLIRDRLISEGGWIQRNDVTSFNLYRAPTIEPGDATKAGPWLDHMHKLWGNDAGHIIKWCAQRVQHPKIKINHALVFGSEKQGIGKDAGLEPVKQAIGPWNFGEVNPQQLLGRFNGFLKRVILRVNEARDLGDVTRYSFYDHTKLYTASPPDVLLVDEKNLREHSILNCVGLILTTNYKTTGIYLPAEDRRHYVAWTNMTPGDFPEGYWIKLFGWYNEGGDRHAASYLREYDLSGFDPKEPPPKTQAFWDIVDANRAPEDAELADALDALGNPDVTILRHVIDEAGLEFADWLRDHKNRRAIPHRFEQCGYVPVRNPDRKDQFWKVAGKRTVVYARNGLSISDQLKAVSELVERERVPEHLVKGEKVFGNLV